MFERFTKGAREAVSGAVAEAESTGAHRVDALHLLTAVAGTADAAAVLRALDISGAAVSDRVEELRRQGGLSDVDRHALSELGIDVDTVVARVEHEHGQGVLAGHPRRRRWHTPFAGDAKRVLEASLHEALEIREKHIGAEHVLLALATVPGPAADVLVAAGVQPRRLHAVLRQRRQAA
ncbi:hypothetical protein BJF85_20190 [Saccharomonospora sp. CUA-673]|uniref:Clp protease N-terminal domain-containing protein n=1 Tax=Saccharomonospora sp. CUA-673 TaxID=1904969 RepID=UPI000963C817|nr:Clp protease N-terminal domain-containing protein [Saccharomonospora sp. CUA-673]OLT44231.1 hypothetical protein BJF85_20190 [Saccharomonospora sp. CUA-673]